MKFRNFANRFLLVLMLVMLCLTQASVYTSLPILQTAEASTPKTYYLDQYNDDAVAGKSLYDTLGIKVYNDYLQAVDAAQGLNDVVIAVVDSGLDSSYPVFANRILSDYAMDFSQGITATMNTTWNQDQNGHGTHVAGVIADITLDNVKILPIRIFCGLDNQSHAYAFNNAIRYICALKNGESVSLYNNNGFETTTKYNKDRVKLNIIAVNLSLGTEGYDVSDSNAMSEYQKDKYGYYQGMAFNAGYQTVIDSLLACDILPIVAAGNRSSDELVSKSYYSLPGTCDGVLAVSAYDNTDLTGGKYWLADFSYHNDFISVSAPGTEIWSACSQDIVALLSSAQKNILQIDTHGEYRYYEYSSEQGSGKWYIRQDSEGNYYLRESGTSMATPYVTACYALLMSDSSKTTAESFGLEAWDATDKDADYMTYAHKALLAAAASKGDQGAEGYDEYFGYGIIHLSTFASATAESLSQIENKIPASTTVDQNINNNKTITESETDWLRTACILVLGGMLVWSVGLFNATVKRKKGASTNDDN